MEEVQQGTLKLRTKRVLRFIETADGEKIKMSKRANELFIKQAEEVGRLRRQLEIAALNSLPDNNDNSLLSLNIVKLEEKMIQSQVDLAFKEAMIDDLLKRLSKTLV